MAKRTRKLADLPPLPWRPILFMGVQFAELRMSRSGKPYVDATQPHWWERAAVKALSLPDRSRIREAIVMLRDHRDLSFECLPAKLGEAFCLGDVHDA